MPSIWKSLCDIIGTLISKTKPKVTFSPSTLHRELERQSKLTASPNPFYNFLSDYAMRMQRRNYAIPGRNIITNEEAERLSINAQRLWSTMTDEQRRPYVELALEQQRKEKNVRPRTVLSKKASSTSTSSAKRLTFQGRMTRSKTRLLKSIGMKPLKINASSLSNANRLLNNARDIERIGEESDNCVCVGVATPVPDVIGDGPQNVVAATVPVEVAKKKAPQRKSKKVAAKKTPKKK